MQLYYLIRFGGARAYGGYTWLRMHPSDGVHDPWLGLVTLIASAADDPSLPEAYWRLIFNSTQPLIHSNAYSIILGYAERNVFIVIIFALPARLARARVHLSQCNDVDKMIKLNVNVIHILTSWLCRRDSLDSRWRKNALIYWKRRTDMAEFGGRDNYSHRWQNELYISDTFDQLKCSSFLVKLDCIPNLSEQPKNTVKFGANRNFRLLHHENHSGNMHMMLLSYTL